MKAKISCKKFLLSLRMDIAIEFILFLMNPEKCRDSKKMYAWLEFFLFFLRKSKICIRKFYFVSRASCPRYKNEGETPSTHFLISLSAPDLNFL